MDRTATLFSAVGALMLFTFLALVVVALMWAFMGTTAVLVTVFLLGCVGVLAARR